jgi:H+/Cl- antiporter ClcA
MQQTAKYLIIVGIIIVVIGLIMYAFGDKLDWFGNLPGDIKIKKEHFRFYAPITSMILLSALVTLILWIIHKIR